MSTAESKAQTVKERAGYALNNDFLRNAVKFTTERLRLGKSSRRRSTATGMRGGNGDAKSGSILSLTWIII